MSRAHFDTAILSVALRQRIAAKAPTFRTQLIAQSSANGQPPAAEPAERPAPRRRRWPRQLFVTWLVLTTLGLLVAGGYAGVEHWQNMAAQAQPEALPIAEPIKRCATTPPEPASPAVSEAEPSEDADAKHPVPKHTRASERGELEVVDIGLSEPSLAAALMGQRSLAYAKQQRMLVMLGSQRCRACPDIDAALESDPMQAALAGVRLVRVDIVVFQSDLVRLRIPHKLYPAFFLLGPELTPRDAIHAGEWDEDVAANIAPVLGAFVKGQYAQRRFEWLPCTDSMKL